MLRPLTPGDWPAVAAAYADGIETRQATFETVVPEWDAWDAARLPWGRVVAVENDLVVGWIAASPTSSRPCYAGVVEHGVYVAARARGRGHGRRLLTAFIESADGAGAWMIETSIFPQNEASLALHIAAGFRVVGTRERIAQLDGQWRDTVLLELRL